MYPHKMCAWAVHRGDALTRCRCGALLRRSSRKRTLVLSSPARRCVSMHGRWSRQLPIRSRSCFICSQSRYALQQWAARGVKNK